VYCNKTTDHGVFTVKWRDTSPLNTESLKTNVNRDPSELGIKLYDRVLMVLDFATVRDT